MMKTILIVDDEPAARYGLRRALEAKYRIAEADSAEAAQEALPREQPDLVLLDVVLPGQDGLSFLRWMREQGSEVPVLMVSALDTAKTAVEALQLGAADYLVKGFELEELRQRVATLLKLATLEKENDALRRRLTTEGQFGQMIGRSAEMRHAFEMADRVAPADSTVLILGESGTGKDLLAQEIHARSPRSGKAYVAVNCAALPETLIESELFGFERGAFSGAAQQKNGNLWAEIRAGKFREDLFYRLRFVTIDLPPLRAHKEDIALLTETFLQMHGARLGRTARLKREAMATIEKYDWPGNVRELKNALARRLGVSRGDEIGLEDLPGEVVHGETTSLKHRGGENDNGIGERDFREAKRKFEVAYLTRQLAEHRWNVSRTAATIGLHRQSLQEKLRELGIRRPGREPLEEE